MSEYTPRLDDLREAFVATASEGCGMPRGECDHYAEFDRWLAAHDAEIRADAWDEGALWAAVETGAIRDENTEWLTPEDNPYRTPRPPAPELFPGVQERLDALTIRKATP